jgi:5-methylcytosine-specific restriction endonuclease McrA
VVVKFSSVCRLPPRSLQRDSWAEANLEGQEDDRTRRAFRDYQGIDGGGMIWHKARFTERASAHRFDCLHCDRPMWFPASKLGKYKTCGAECSMAMRAESKRARAKACETCGKQFTPRPRQIEAGQGRFCSQACNTSHRRMNTPEAQMKARANWKRRWLKSPFIPGGKDSPRWRGGKEAARLRRLKKVAEYKRQNPDKLKAWAANRRSRGGPKAPSAIVAFLKAAQRGRCAVCGDALAKGFHLDHVYPLALGGTNHKSNFQLLCRACNLHKAAKDPIEFMRSLGRLL